MQPPPSECRPLGGALANALGWGDKPRPHGDAVDLVKAVGHVKVIRREAVVWDGTESLTFVLACQASGRLAGRGTHSSVRPYGNTVKVLQ